MKTPGPYKEKQLNGRQWFWFLAFMGLLTRLSMLRLSAAETTDGILSMTYFSPDLVATPRNVLLPGYPSLLWLGQGIGLPGWIWGRLLAILAGLLFLIPLWKFSRRWVSTEMSGMICLMAIFSPLLWQWSLKVMPDTLFLLFFFGCLERTTAAFVEKRVSVWSQGCLLGAAAALTRPEGFLLLPWIAYTGNAIPKPGSWNRIFLTALLWAAPLYFMKDRFLLLLQAYQEGAGMLEGPGKVDFPLLNFIDHFYAYLTQPLYVFTPLLFWFAILGLAKMMGRKDQAGSAFKKIVIPIYLLLFLSRLIPTQYQDRHMLPFLPLLLVAAGFQLETFVKSLGEKKGSFRAMFWKNGLLSLGLVWLALFSGAVLICQSDSFGDIKRSSGYLRTLPDNAVIYSDEAPKTQYWSGRKVRPLMLPFKPGPGDYVVYHSFYTPRLNAVEQFLQERHQVLLVDRQESMVVPLLTDVMSDPRLQNRIASTAFRFQPQFFKSVVYRIQKW